MPRVIYKCQSKTCKADRAIDYPERRKFHAGYGRMQTVYSRIDPVRGRVDLGYDGICHCGAYCKSGTVKGRVTDHVCDPRCSSATGFNCECQCGGKNHGADHMIRAAA